MTNRLAENIRVFRKERGLTQEQLAEVLGVTVGAVYKWEAKLSLPELSLIMELADFFDLSVDALLAARPDLAGCMFLPGDQPLLQRETVESMVGIFGRDTKTRIEQQKETEREIFRLAHRFINDPNPLVGSPVLFSKRYFSELRILPEGKGGSVLLRKYPERVHNIFIGDRNELLDADTPEALAELLRILRQ